MKPKLLFLLTVVAAACASPDRASQGDVLLDRGDYDGALARYAQDLSAHPDDPVLVRKLETARRMLWRVDRERAADAIERGDLEAAESLLTRVIDLDASDREAKSRLREVQDGRRSIEKAIADARRLLDDGDPEAARKALEPHLARIEFYPEAMDLLQRADEARREAALAETAAALDREEFGSALAAAKRATAVLPVSPRAQDALTRAQAGLEASELTMMSTAAREQGDYRQAITLARRALTLRPGLSIAEAALAAARTDGARINVEAAARDLGAGRPQDALRRLEAAGVLDPEFTGEIQAGVRERVASDLLECGRVHEAAGRPALALLHYDRALDVHSGLPGIAPRVAAARAAVDAALRVSVGVADLQNSARIPVDAIGITRSAIARYRGEGLLGWVAIQPGGEVEGETDVVVSGEITSFVTRVSPPTSRRRTVEYVKSSTFVPNPAHDVAGRRVEEAERVLADRENRLRDERRKLAILLENPWDSMTSGSYRRNPDLVRSAYQTAVLEARLRIRNAEEAVERASAAAGGAREASYRVPSTLEKKVTGRYTYTETTRIASGRTEASLRLTRASDGEVLAREEAYGGISIEDTRAPAYEPAGLGEDPDDLPDEEAMRDLLVDALARNLATRMRTMIESLAAAHLPAKDASPDDPATHEAWARYLLSGVRGEGSTREDVASRLREATGLAVPPLPGTIQGDAR